MIVAIALIVLIVLLVLVLLILVIVYADRNEEEWIYLPFYKKLRSLGENPPEYTRILTDKLRVKEVVSDCPNLHIAKVVWSSDSCKIPPLTDILDRNRKYIMKANNASNRNIIITSDTNRAALENKAREWLSTSYPTANTTEKFYSTIKPRVFIEEMIDLDYELRVFCFHGVPSYIRYKKGNCVSYYNNKWQKIDLMQYYSKSCTKVNIDTVGILEVCEHLSKKIAFVCVDLMITKDKEIYFGEYTFCPNNSARTFVPDRYQMEFSNLWKYLD